MKNIFNIKNIHQIKLSFDVKINDTFPKLFKKKIRFDDSSPSETNEEREFFFAKIYHT